MLCGALHPGLFDENNNDGDRGLEPSTKLAGVFTQPRISSMSEDAAKQEPPPVELFRAVLKSAPGAEESDVESTTADSSSFEEPVSTFGQNRNKKFREQAAALPSKQKQPASQIGHPRAYYLRLWDIKADARERSLINILRKREATLNAMRGFVTADLALPEEEIFARFEDRIFPDGVRDSDILDWCSSMNLRVPPHNDGPEMSRLLFGMLECRNILFLTLQSATRLQHAQFVKTQITAFIAEDGRPNVANHVSIPISILHNLAHSFSSTLSALYKDHRHTMEGDIPLEVLRRVVNDLDQKCKRTLRDFGFPEFVFRGGEIWFCLACFLDLALQVYVGVHVEDFDATEDEEYLVPSVIAENIDSPIILRRYTTSCLDGFLSDEKVWVFHAVGSSIQSPIYLSTGIQDFADIWGPVWRVQDKGDTRIKYYDVGNGYIHPWSHHAKYHPMLKANERLCHWTPKENPWSEAQGSPLYDAREFMNRKDSLPAMKTTDRLLIGARRRHRNPMVWSRCRCDIRAIEQRLRRNHRLQHLGASRDYSYVDGRQVSVVGGAHGASMGLGITIKSAKGKSFKEVFVNLWEKQPELRNPRDLEHLWGVTISLCTMNAERVSVFELLNTPSMHRLLDRFDWTDQRRKDGFFRALLSGNLDNLCYLWDQHRDWHDELGKALFCCFRELSYTGFDSDCQEFKAFWISPGSNLLKQVLMKPSEHTWIKFLRDSEVSFTVAVMVEDCLRAKFPGQNIRLRCGDNQRGSALQTSICVNDEIDPCKQLVRSPVARLDADGGPQDWEWTWDVSNLKRGGPWYFPFGPQGRLKTLHVLTRSRLILEWDLVWTDVLRKAVGMSRRERESHWEYTELVDLPIRPIPVYLLSPRS
jgi:hypothetical protein